MERTAIRSGTPAASTGEHRDRDPLRPGDRVGRYLVTELLGEGGMGVVYAALDPELQRSVAIKLLRLQDTGDSDVSEGQARLQREAHAMAQLSHPNVVPIHDVGRFEDQLFIAMELVRGVTLDVWLQQEKRTWRDVLAVFDGAGRGLAAAHDAGLIHRDFKPANVLIGEDGRPRVADFGLARTLVGPQERKTLPADETSLNSRLTQTGWLMGTPRYMAPEQFMQGAASPATDQFSFCVALHEALYALHPFEADTLQELTASVASGQTREVPRGSGVPGWLRPIVLKGLARAPEARYPSMHELLAALGRDPWRARRQWLAAASVVVLVGAGAAAYESKVHSQAKICQGAERAMESAWGPDVQRRAQRAFEATGKSYAPDVWRRTREQMDAYAREWLSERGRLCESSGLASGAAERTLALQLSCLDRRLDEFGALAGALTAADAQTVSRAYAATTSLSALSACSESQAVGDWRRHLAPAARQAAEEIEKRVARAKGVLAAGKYQDARTQLEPALADAERVGLEPLIADAEFVLGSLESRSLSHAKAKEAQLQALKAAEAAGDDALAEQALQHLVLEVGSPLNQPEEGRTLARVAEGKIQRLGGDPLATGRLARARGSLESSAGNLELAVGLFREAIAAVGKAEGPDPLEIADIQIDLAWDLMLQGKLAEARTEVEHALAIQTAKLGPDHPELRKTWNTAGAIASQQDDLPEAQRCFETLLALSEAALPPKSVGLVTPLGNLAEARIYAGHPESALPLLDRGEAILAGDAHPNPASVAHLSSVRAMALRELGRAGDAEAQSRKALQTAESALGPEHPSVADELEELGADLNELGREREALPLLERARGLLQKTGTWDAARGGQLRVDLGIARSGLHDWPAARDELEAALASFKKAGTGRYDQANAGLRLAEVLWHTGDKARARQLAEVAAKLDVKYQRRQLRERAQAWLAAHAA